MTIVLTSNALPATPYSLTPAGGSMATLNPAGGTGKALLAVTDPLSTLPGQGGQGNRAVLTQTVPGATGGTHVFTAIKLDQVVQVVSNGVVFKAAVDPANPQPGEFLYDPYQATLTVYVGGAYSLPAGFSVQIIGRSSASPVPFKKRVDPSSLPAWIYTLQCQGTISWECSAEQHPTGSISLVTDDRAIVGLRTGLTIGTRLPMFGWGFAVRNYAEHQALASTNPNGYYEISVSLEGWNEKAVNEPVFYFSNPGNPLGDYIYNDPVCYTFGQYSQTTIAQLINLITVQQLASRNGINLVGPYMRIILQSTTQYVTGKTTVAQELEQQLRPIGAFVDYSGDVVQVRYMNAVGQYTLTDADVIDKPSLTYQGKKLPQSTLTSAYLQTPQPQNGQPLPSAPVTQSGRSLTPEDTSLIGIGFEYKKTAVTGTFVNPSILTGGIPLTSWVGDPGAGSTISAVTSLGGSNLVNAVTPTRKSMTNVKGSVNPEVPPTDVTSIKNMSLNFDVSGPTKTKQTEYTLDGVPIWSETEVWGFCYTAAAWATFSGSSYTLNIGPDAFSTIWVKVRFERLDYNYDPVTGYLYRVDTSGWEIHRVKQETDAFETIKLSTFPITEIYYFANLDNGDYFTASYGTGDTLKKYRQRKLYTFVQIPLVGVTKYYLRLFSDFYKDALSSIPGMLTGRKCLPDGSSVPATQLPKGWVLPMWPQITATYSSTFISVSSPDPPGKDPNGHLIEPPPYTTGKELYTRTEDLIVPGANTIVQPFSRVIAASPNGGGAGSPYSYVPAPSYGSSPAVSNQDMYTQSVEVYSAQGGSFSEVAQESSFQTFTGRPKEQIQLKPYAELLGDPSTQPGPQNPANYDYYVVTTPNSVYGAQEGSVNYTYALTETQADVAVTTEWQVQDVKQACRTLTLKIPFNGNIRPMDQVTAIVNGVIYKCRVNHVSHSLKLFGVLDGAPLVEGETELALSPDRVGPVQWYKFPLPPAPAPQSNLYQPGGTHSVPTYSIGDFELGSMQNSAIRTRRNY